MFLRTKLQFQALALLPVLGMVVAGGLLLLFGQQSLDQSRQMERMAEQRRNDVDRRLAQVTDEEKEILDGHALFQRLAARQQVGEENRKAWIEQLTLIREQRQLFDLSWEIAPRRTFGPTLESGGEILQFMLSSLRLSLPLLHEQDLLHLLNDLEQQLPAYVRLRRCTLSRRAAHEEDKVGLPHLDADCELELITLLRSSLSGVTPKP